MAIVDKTKVEQNKRELFQKLMNLVPKENRDEVIQIWVDATFEQYWLGWEEGYDAGYFKR